MNRLAGKVAIITGAAQGMGEAHAIRFVEEGAQVMLTDVNADAVAALADRLGPHAQCHPHDVTSEDQWQSVVQKTEASFGHITVLVNNAGIIGPQTSTVDMKASDFDKVCAVNQSAVFYGMKHVIPSMLRAGSGSIINISSISGIVAIYGTPNLAYSASKFAVRGLTKYVAIEYGPNGIRANSVHPGYILTPMATEALDEESTKVASASVPIRRMAQPSEVSDLVVFLASDESRFITGAEHVIDGGLTSL